ncbi:hypothetical protein GCM10009599_28760 [Luteococcus peritonei]
MGIAALTACGSSSGDTSSSPGAGEASQQGTTSCSYPVGGSDPSRPVDPPNDANVPSTGTVSATITIDDKPVTITMDRAKAPCTVNNFESLARQGFYDDIRCHRLLNAGGFVLQCGDPSGTGRGGPGYTFADELTGQEEYTAGTVAMANAGPDTNGSQFFLVYEQSGFKPEYTVFGQMDQAGVQAVTDIAARGMAGNESPAAPARISKVTLG